VKAQRVAPGASPTDSGTLFLECPLPSLTEVVTVLEATNGNAGTGSASLSSASIRLDAAVTLPVTVLANYDESDPLKQAYALGSSRIVALPFQSVLSASPSVLIARNAESDSGS